jgi:hypothetical protein
MKSVSNQNVDINNSDNSAEIPMLIVIMEL